MSYRRTVRRTRRGAGLIVVVLTLGGLVGGWLLEHSRGPEYRASTDVLVQFWGIQGFLLTGQSNAVSSQDVADAATLATSPDVLDLAASQLHDGRDGTALASVVSAVPQSFSNGFSIVATGPTATAARQTSQQVAAATSAVLQQRIASTSTSLSALAQGDLVTSIRQRAQVLTSSVQPLEVLRTAAPTAAGPTATTPLMLGVVGLAAGVLLVIVVSFARPVVHRPRDAQRLTELPAIPFSSPEGGPDASRLLRRLLADRPDGQLLIVPVDGASEERAQEFARWARLRTVESRESARIAVVADPVTLVLDPRSPAEVAAVVLVSPAGVSTRTLSDAVALLRTWRSADVVVVPS